MVKEALKQFVINLPGWHTNRKILVIESDDWGSIRMPSEKVWEKLNRNPHIDVSNRPNQLDTLASSEDLSNLFQLLKKFKDVNLNHPCITANCVMANPDFEAIKRNNFEEYYYETLEETFEKYNNQSALNLWDKGFSEGIFIPQFHGREHVNVPFWLEKLKENYPGVREAFDLRVFGCNFPNLNLKGKSNFQRAWDFYDQNQEAKINKGIEEGLDMFYNRFGFRSLTAIPPSYTCSSNQEKTLFKKGVKSLQGIAIQKQPVAGKNNYNFKYRYTKKGDRGLGFTQRNAFLEIAGRDKEKGINDALNRINVAFQWKKPAIIGMHRVNFVSGLGKKNRDENLAYLNSLLSRVLKKWPDVEFMSSAGLQNLMRSN